MEPVYRDYLFRTADPDRDVLLATCKGDDQMTNANGSGNGNTPGWKVETVVMVLGFLFTSLGTVISYQVLQQNVFESNRQLYERLTRVEALIEVNFGKQPEK
jgi:hypothetical protein